MQRHRLHELVRVRQLRARLAQSEASRCLQEYAKAQAALAEIRQRIADFEQQAHSWGMQPDPSGATSFDAGYMHNLMSCREHARTRAREAAVSLPRAELARQRAHSAARDARQIWSREARRADVVAQQLKQLQLASRRRQQHREEEQLAEERSTAARTAYVHPGEYR